MAEIESRERGQFFDGGFVSADIVWSASTRVDHLLGHGGAPLVPNPPGRWGECPDLMDAVDESTLSRPASCTSHGLGEHSR